MKISAIRLFGVTVFVATCLGCGVGGNVFRDSVNVASIPVAWLGNSGGTPNSPNSDDVTRSKWGPRN